MDMSVPDGVGTRRRSQRMDDIDQILGRAWSNHSVLGGHLRVPS
jgi:hypothetical protein